MIPLAAMTMTRPAANPWLAAVYAVVISAILAAIATLLFANNAIIAAIFYLLSGIGPVIGAQLAAGRAFDIKAIIGAIIGSIPIIILWPILVGALARGQSIGRLILASIIANIVAWVVFLILGSVMGQDPSWFPVGFTLAVAVWGGAMAAMMTVWAEVKAT
jgi:hypothetical protein